MELMPDVDAILATESIATLDAADDGGTMRLPAHALLQALLHRALRDTALANYRETTGVATKQYAMLMAMEVHRVNVISRGDAGRVKFAVSVTSHHQYHADLQLRTGGALVLRVGDQLRPLGRLQVGTTFLSPTRALGKGAALYSSHPRALVIIVRAAFDKEMPLSVAERRIPNSVGDTSALHMVKLKNDRQALLEELAAEADAAAGAATGANEGVNEGAMAGANAGAAAPAAAQPGGAPTAAAAPPPAARHEKLLNLERAIGALELTVPALADLALAVRDSMTIDHP